MGYNDSCFCRGNESCSACFEPPKPNKVTHAVRYSAPMYAAAATKLNVGGRERAEEYHYQVRREDTSPAWYWR